MVPFSMRNTRGQSLSAVSTFCSTSRIETPALVDAVNFAADLRDQPRHDAFGRLVQNDQLRPHHQAAGDREHLLLAAGQCAARLLQALLETGKAGQHIFLRSLSRMPGTPIVRFSRTDSVGKMPRPCGT